MKSLLKLAFLTSIGTVAWKGWRDWKAKRGRDDRGGAGSSGIIRDAGPAEQHVNAEDWDLVDEQSDESFPASDPPANFRGVA